MGALAAVLMVGGALVEWHEGSRSMSSTCWFVPFVLYSFVSDWRWGRPDLLAQQRHCMRVPKGNLHQNIEALICLALPCFILSLVSFELAFLGKIDRTVASWTVVLGWTLSGVFKLMWIAMPEPVHDGDGFGNLAPGFGS